MRNRWRSSVSLVLLAALAAPGAQAAEARLKLDSDLTWTETPIQLRIEVVDPSSNIVACDLPAVAGLNLEGPFRGSSQTSIVNGKRSQSLTIPYRITPVSGRKGKFTLGPAKVKCQDGTILSTRPVELLVYDRPEIGAHLEAELVPEGGPAGAPFRVIYTLYYFGEVPDDDDGFFTLMRRGGGLGLSELELPVLSISGAKVEPVQAFEDREAQPLHINGQHKVILQKGAAERDGKGYLTYAFAFDVTPYNPGPIELGGAKAGIRLKTGRTVVRRDPFGQRYQADEDKVFSASSPSAVYQVSPLPSEGRPAGFNGAVGQYRIAVTASPTEVDEGAPITLEIRVTGSGLIEELKPPIWTEIQSLTRDFSVSGDVDSGRVEQGAKVFRQLLRPQNDRVKAIPPIPFPYYDPTLRKYQVALSEAIPIQVRAVKVVDGSSAVSSPRSVATPVTRPQAAEGPLITGKDGIGANFESIGRSRPALDPRDELLSPLFLAGTAGPPLLLAVVAAVLRLRRRDPALRRRGAALANALRALGTASEPAAVAAILETYFRDRLSLPPGEVTPNDARRALERSGAPAAPRDVAAGLLERAQAARFGAGGSSGASLGDEARKVLEEVEICLRG